MRRTFQRILRVNVSASTSMASLWPFFGVRIEKLKTPRTMPPSRRTLLASRRIRPAARRISQHQEGRGIQDGVTHRETFVDPVTPATICG